MEAAGRFFYCSDLYDAFRVNANLDVSNWNRDERTFSMETKNAFPTPFWEWIVSRTPLVFTQIPPKIPPYLKQVPRVSRIVTHKTTTCHVFLHICPSAYNPGQNLSCDLRCSRPAEHWPSCVVIMAGNKRESRNVIKMKTTSPTEKDFLALRSI